MEASFDYIVVTETVQEAKCYVHIAQPCNETQMIDVQYSKALYSLSSRLTLACIIREQTYIAVNNVTMFSSFFFSDFILHNLV